MRQQGVKGWEQDDSILGGNDTLLPSQFWTALGDPRLEPEKRLMVAVVEDALSLVLAGERSGGEERRTEVREAERWFASEDRSRTFAFATICDVLGIDAGRVRQALAGWRRRQRVFRRPRLQAGRGRHQVSSPRRAA